MSIIEITLSILVVVWTLMFIAIAVALVVFLRQIKKALDRIDNILKTVDDTASDISMPLKMVASALVGAVAKNSVSTVKNLIRSKLKKKRQS